MRNIPFLLTLESFEDIAPQVRHFTFSIDQSIDFTPGQFVTLKWGDQLRSYSLAHYSAKPTPYLELSRCLC